MIEFLLDCALLVAAPLFFSGLVRFIQTRSAEHPLTVLRGFTALIGEGVKPGNDKNFIYETASSLIFASIFMAGVLVPMINHKAVIGFDNAGILFFSFLILEKIIRMFGDKRDPARGKEDQKIMALVRDALPELTLYILLIAASWTSGSLSFEKIFGFSAGMSGRFSEAVLRVLFPMTLGFLLIRSDDSCEDGYHGSDRAAVMFSKALKEFLIAALIAGFVIPYVKGLNALLYLFVFLVVLVLIAVLTGTFRSLLGRSGNKKLPDILLAAGVSAIVLFSVLSPLI